MRNRRIVIGLFVCVLFFEAQAVKRPVTEAERLQHEVERLQREIKRQPGEMELHCALAEAQLEAGDTTDAEKSLTYAMKMRETPCLYIKKAGIECSRKEYFSAARNCAGAVKAGLRPAEEPMIQHIDSLSGGGVRLCLQRMAMEDKQNSALPYGLAQMAIQRGDTATALQYYGNAFHLGDSTAQEAIRNLRSVAPASVTSDCVIAQIPFLNQYDLLELRGKINGLAIRIIVDSTATQSTISGVETLFMLKNNYVAKEDIHDNTIVVIKRLEIGESMVLQDIRLRYIEKQESPVILCLRDLERLGRVQIDEKKRILTIRK